MQRSVQPSKAEMSVRWLRLLGAALVAEAAPILLLVVLVALLGPNDPALAPDYAAYLGAWVGPIGGAVATFLLAIWVGKKLVAGHRLHGTLLGVIVAVLDAALLAAGAPDFQLLFVFSALGRVMAGAAGGMVAKRRATGVSATAPAEG